MKTNVLAGLAAAASVVSAAESICDTYTTALLTNNTAANQQTLLTLLVNTAVIGNYTTPNVGIKVPGILTAGTYNGTAVNLLPYFDGALDSTNTGGSSGVSVNFLDGGGAAPLEKDMAADNTTSAQYVLLTHLYEYFAYLLGCSLYGNTTSPYTGSTSMYSVHKYMGLSRAEVGYFIEQVGLSAASFGVSTADVDAVGTALEDAFGYRCSPPESIPATATAALQSICIDEDCPLSPNATCSAYAPVVEPMNATTTSNSTTSSNTTSPMASGTGSMNATSSIVPFTGGAAAVSAASTVLMAAIGMFAFSL